MVTILFTENDKNVYMLSVKTFLSGLLFGIYNIFKHFTGITEYPKPKTITNL